MLFLSIPLVFLRLWLAEVISPLVLVVQGLERRIYFPVIPKRTRVSKSRVFTAKKVANWPKFVQKTGLTDYYSIR